LNSELPEPLSFESNEQKQSLLQSVNNSKKQSVFRTEASGPVLYINNTRNRWYTFDQSEDPTIHAFESQYELFTYIKTLCKGNYIDLEWTITKDLLKRSSTIFLDTTVFTSILIQKDERYIAAAHKLLNSVEVGDIKAVASVLTMHSIILGKTKDARDQIYLLLSKFKNLTLLPIDTEIVKLSIDLNLLKMEELLYATAINYARNHENIAFVTFGEPKKCLQELDCYCFY
jgi:predicted nucleic acid-binding protein